MAFIISHASDTNKGATVNFGTGTIDGSGTATLSASTTYNYVNYTVASGATLTVGHKTIIRCTGTFTLASGGAITIGNFSGTPAVGASNGYWGGSGYYICGGGAAGSTSSGTPYGAGSGWTQSLYVRAAQDYLTYSAASPVSILTDPTDNMGGGTGGSLGNQSGGVGKGAFKIIANKIVFAGSLNGSGVSGTTYDAGTQAGSGGGAGGICWLVAPIITGGGTVTLGGGSGVGGGGGGAGRLRCDYALGSAPTFTNGGGATGGAVITTYQSMSYLSSGGGILWLE